MTLIADRVREVLWLFRKQISVDPKYKYLDQIPINDLLPPLEKDIARAILRNEEQAEASLVWLANAVYYMTGDTDELPPINIEWKID